jgi:hypothetical protein
MNQRYLATRACCLHDLGLQGSSIDRSIQKRPCRLFFAYSEPGLSFVIFFACPKDCHGVYRTGLGMWLNHGSAVHTILENRA